MTWSLGGVEGAVRLPREPGAADDAAALHLGVAQLENAVGDGSTRPGLTNLPPVGRTGPARHRTPWHPHEVGHRGSRRHRAHQAASRGLRALSDGPPLRCALPRRRPTPDHHRGAGPREERYAERTDSRPAAAVDGPSSGRCRDRAAAPPALNTRMAFAGTHGLVGVPPRSAAWSRMLSAPDVTGAYAATSKPVAYMSSTPRAMLMSTAGSSDRDLE